MDWTERTMTLPRAMNFAVFCGTVAGMMVVEVLWSKDVIGAMQRNSLQMAGFLAITAMCVGEGVLRWCEGRPNEPREPRGFPVKRKDEP